MKLPTIILFVLNKMITQKPNKLSKELLPYDNTVVFDESPLPKKPCNYCILGRKGCGKTTLFLNLLNKKHSPWNKMFHTIHLFSPTAEKDDKMADLVDELMEDGQFFDELSDESIDVALENIEQFNKQWKEKKKKGKPCHLLVYDDCIHFLKGKKSRKIDEIFTQNRHYGVYNIILLQKWNSYMPTIIRANLDCISFFGSANKKERKSFVDEMNMDEDLLERLIEYSTSEPYSFLHINMYSKPTRFYKKFDRLIIDKE